MELRNIGLSDIQVTPLTFGAWAIGGWQWGGDVDKKAAIDAIHRAIDMGINSIDTAPVYGLGLSEEIVGEAIKGLRDKVNIFTKCGIRWDIKKGEYFFDSNDLDGNPITLYKYSGKESIIEECERSLKRLNMDYIDLYQIHWPDSTTPIDESMEAMAKLLEDGKIRAAGVCNYEIKHLEEARTVLAIVSDQIPYSMVNRGIEKDVIPYCIKNNMGILAYSPLQRGLLTGKITPDYQFKGDDHRKENPFFTIENRKKVLNLLEKIKPIAEGHNATLAQVVLNWTVHRPGITTALVGTRNIKQAEDNFKALDFNLTEEEMAQITKWADETKLEI